MKIEIIGANIKLAPESAAEICQLKEIAAKLEHQIFAHARKYQWELQSVTLPLKHDGEMSTHEKQALDQASNHVHIQLD